MIRFVRVVLAAGLVSISIGTGPVLSQDDPFGEDWPRTEGWEETGYLCSACHSLALVKQQGLPRFRWDQLLDWMVEEQGMAEPDAEERELILDYLTRHFNPERRQTVR